MGASPPHRGSTHFDVISFGDAGDAAVAYEGRGDGGKGEEVFGLALVAAVKASTAGQPGPGPFHDAAAPARTSG